MKNLISHIIVISCLHLLWTANAVAAECKAGEEFSYTNSIASLSPLDQDGVGICSATATVTMLQALDPEKYSDISPIMAAISGTAVSKRKDRSGRNMATTGKDYKNLAAIEGGFIEDVFQGLKESGFCKSDDVVMDKLWNNKSLSLDQYRDLTRAINYLTKRYFLRDRRPIQSIMKSKVQPILEDYFHCKMNSSPNNIHSGMLPCDLSDIDQEAQRYIKGQELSDLSKKFQRNKDADIKDMQNIGIHSYWIEEKVLLNSLLNSLQSADPGRSLFSNKYRREAKSSIDESLKMVNDYLKIVDEKISKYQQRCGGDCNSRRDEIINSYGEYGGKLWNLNDFRVQPFHSEHYQDVGHWKRVGPSQIQTARRRRWRQYVSNYVGRASAKDIQSYLQDYIKKSHSYVHQYLSSADEENKRKEVMETRLNDILEEARFPPLSDSSDQRVLRPHLIGRHCWELREAAFHEKPDVFKNTMNKILKENLGYNQEFSNDFFEREYEAMIDDKKFLESASDRTCRKNLNDKFADLGCIHHDKKVVDSIKMISTIAADLDHKEIFDDVADSLDSGHDRKRLKQAFGGSCIEKGYRIDPHLQIRTAPGRYAPLDYELTNKDFGIIKNSLMHRRPVGLSLCASYLRNASPEVSRKQVSNNIELSAADHCGPHAVTLIGLRCNNGNWEYLMRNSWGADVCSSYRNRTKFTGEECNNVTGDLWLKESSLKEMTFNYDIFTGF